ncbi:hypothetical protein BDZ91DRAFT_751030 [Kalaharituber pfeilii]|nr:hypothetical protein BDZ91DRAFT_751030 [Kalaharituber pfeilii]
MDYTAYSYNPQFVTSSMGFPPTPQNDFDADSPPVSLAPLSCLFRRAPFRLSEFQCLLILFTIPFFCIVSQVTVQNL